MPRGTRKKFVLGIIGAVGGGKSWVASLFKELGASVIDADRIAHGVIQRPDTVRAIVRRWGKDVLNSGGRLRRRAVADAAFANRASVKALNAVVHPRVRREIVRKLSQSRGVVVLDAPLLLEAKARRFCDAVLFVEAPKRVRRSRARSRGWGPNELARRERFQLSPEAKRRAADFVVDNGGARGAARRQVKKIFKIITSGG